MQYTASVPDISGTGRLPQQIATLFYRTERRPAIGDGSQRRLDWPLSALLGHRRYVGYNIVEGSYRSDTRTRAAARAQLSRLCCGDLVSALGFSGVSSETLLRGIRNPLGQHISRSSAAASRCPTISTISYGVCGAMPGRLCAQRGKLTHHGKTRGCRQGSSMTRGIGKAGAQRIEHNSIHPLYSKYYIGYCTLS